MGVDIRQIQRSRKSGKNALIPKKWLK
jgi:hypothetical protein